jgi:ATP-dependent protease ClpP protease subunit
MPEQQRRDWFRVENAASPERATVRIFDAIGGWFGVYASDLVEQLDAITAPTIELHVNSPGGDAFEGIAIMNALRQHPSRVEAHVDGMAASAASYIVVGGADEVVMSLGAELMIHNPKMGTFGDAAFHRASADQLDKLAGSMAGIYARKAGGDVADWQAAMDTETWYTADEAVTAGLADRVDDSENVAPAAAAAAAAGAERHMFAYAGREHAPAPRTPAATASGSTHQEGSAPVPFTDEHLTAMRKTLGLAADASEDKIVATMAEVMTEFVKDDPPALPPGTVAVDAATLDELRANALAGVEARAQQQAERRERLVDAAVSDGRIAPARRDHWLAMLAADTGSETVLAGLAPGLIPVAEIGSAADDPHHDVDADALYAAVFGTEG